MLTDRLKPKYYILIGICVLIVAIIATSIASSIFLREREIETWHSQLSNLSLSLAEQTSQSMTSAEMAMNSIVELVNSMSLRDNSELRNKTHTEKIYNVLCDKISGYLKWMLPQSLPLTGMS